MHLFEYISRIIIDSGGSRNTERIWGTPPTNDLSFAYKSKYKLFFLPGTHDGLARDRAKSQTLPLFYREIGFRIDSQFLDIAKILCFFCFVY